MRSESVKPFRVLYISPSYFDQGSFMGGAERYAHELSLETSSRSETVFLSFGPDRISRVEKKLKIEILPRLFRKKILSGHPFSFSFLRWILWADVIHVFQVRNFITDFAIIFSKLFGKRIFLTDLGGGQKYAISYALPLLRWTDGFLAISNYALSQAIRSFRLEKWKGQLKTIYGGVNPAHFKEFKLKAEAGRTVLFTGRLMPHKGIDVLIRAVPANAPWELLILGVPYHTDYYERLKEAAKGKNVLFLQGVHDDELGEFYRKACVTVLPSVYKDCYGDSNDSPELLGLVVLESLASGTPVLVTAVGSLPEIVEDGVDGFVVAPNDAGALREKIEYFIKHPDQSMKMGKKGRDKVMSKFTWGAAADQCFKAYRMSEKQRRKA